MTVPMVDVEYWLEQALAAGLIGPRQRGVALKSARQIFFADRTPDRLTTSLSLVIGTDTLEALLASAGGAIPSLKSADAVQAVRLSASLGQAE